MQIISPSFGGEPYTSVYIPDSVTNIWDWALFGTSLTSVSLKTGTTYQANTFPASCTVESGCIVER